MFGDLAKGPRQIGQQQAIARLPRLAIRLSVHPSQLRILLARVHLFLGQQRIGGLREVLIDRYAIGQSAEEQQELEAVREERRSLSGADVIVGDDEPLAESA